MIHKEDIHIRLKKETLAEIRAFARCGNFKITWVIEQAIAQGFRSVRDRLAPYLKRVK